MKKELHFLAGLTNSRERVSRELDSNLEKNSHILNELMNSDVSYLNLQKVSFQRESQCFGYKEKKLKANSTTAYVKKGHISLDKNKVIIPEAHYYETDKTLNGSNRIRDSNLIDSFPYILHWTLQGEHKQTDDWHLFYRIGGFCGPGGIDATNEHSSLYVLSGYEKFKKLEKVCQDIMKKESEFIREIKHTDDMGSYEEKRSNPWKHKPDYSSVYLKMPWSTVRELHPFAGLTGPLPLPDIKNLRNLMGITEVDESYII